MYARQTHSATLDVDKMHAATLEELRLQIDKYDDEILNIFLNNV
jgi:hypothetical protein